MMDILSVFLFYVKNKPFIPDTSVRGILVLD